MRQSKREWVKKAFWRAYAVLYREGEFGWIIKKATMVTNSAAVRDKVRQVIAGKCWTRTRDHRWMKDAVIQGPQEEKGKTIL